MKLVPAQESKAAPPHGRMSTVLWPWLEEHFELYRTTGNGNVRAMEGLRGFAILLVFFVHYVTLIDPWLKPDGWVTIAAHAVFEVGNAGVDLFFLLSGFLIFGSIMRGSQSYPRFLLRRIQRIYPAFIAVFLLYLGLSFWFPSENRIPSNAAAASLYLLENFLLLPGIFPFRPMITVAWSLSYEIFFYLVLPVCILVLAMRRWTPARRLQFFLVLSFLIFGLCSLWGGPVRLAMFLSGIVLFETLNLKLLRVPNASTTGVIVIIGLACSIPPVTGSLGAALRCLGLFCAFFALCLHCFSKPEDRLAQYLSWLPLRWLGNMSYSYYLLHAIVLRGAFLVLSRFDPPAGESQALFFWGICPAFALTVFFSALLFIFVERPFSLAAQGPKKS